MKTIKTRQWHRSTIVIVNFEQISNIAVVSIVDFEHTNVGCVSRKRIKKYTFT